MNNKNVFTSSKWIFEVSKRFSVVDKSGRSAVTSFLSTVGICLGVMTVTGPRVFMCRREIPKTSKVGPILQERIFRY